MTPRILFAAPRSWAASTSEIFYSAAEYAARLGEHARAVDWLDKAFRQRAFPIVFSFANPVFKPLGDFPRFQEVTRVSLGLPPAVAR